METAPFLTPGAPWTAPLGETILSGWPDFDAMTPLAPGRVTLLDAADGFGMELAFALMADCAVLGRLVHVADGGNSIQAYPLVLAARRRAQARLPHASRSDLRAYEEIVLDRVRLARGFTAHQLQSIVEDGLGLDAQPGQAGLLVAPGLMDMYLDDELARKEAQTLATRALRALSVLAKRLDVPALVVNRALPPGRAHPLRAVLDAGVDESVSVWRGAGAIHLAFPRRGARFLAPPPGMRRLEAFGAEAEPAMPVPDEGWARFSGSARHPKEGYRWKEAA